VCIKLRDTKRANMPKKEVDLESVAQWQLIVQILIKAFWLNEINGSDLLSN
jgi:hypothetical protein